MEESGYRYWLVEYISCESNERYAYYRAPERMDSWEVESNIQLGGVGDDIARIVHIDEEPDFDENEFYHEISE